MATEIELKARVDDPAALRERLEERGRSLGRSVKRDLYLTGPGPDVRLRSVDGRHLVTLKEKAIDGGIETSREIEFAVSDPDAFRAFADALGWRPADRKTKEGEAWDLGDARVELHRVAELGTFLEVEILREDPTADELDDARTRLRELLAELGVPSDAIEPRPYRVLLAEERG